MCWLNVGWEIPSNSAHSRAELSQGYSKYPLRYAVRRTSICLSVSCAARVPFSPRSLRTGIDPVPWRLAMSSDPGWRDRKVSTTVRTSTWAGTFATTRPVPSEAVTDRVTAPACHPGHLPGLGALDGENLQQRASRPVDQVLQREAARRLRGRPHEETLPVDPEFDLGRRVRFRGVLDCHGVS